MHHQDRIANFHHAIRQGNEFADCIAKHVASSSDALKF